MIALLKEFLPRPRKPIRLSRPAAMTIITGARRESIDAVYDRNNRLQHLIVHTKIRSLQ
ncbi:MAG: hypothetical protein KDL10_01310 [Kiritimatiellae bacterium]|nr:hypothetical protein [Kiritimatiellia bacterium]